jgi:hypothetical protein
LSRIYDEYMNAAALPPDSVHPPESDKPSPAEGLRRAAGAPSHYRTVKLAFRGNPHWFNVYGLDTEDSLKKTLKSSGITDLTDDTIAYTDAWSVEESRENGLGDPNCCGSIYLLYDSTLDTLAHEPTHMALGVLARENKTSVPVTTSKASSVEENLCSLVGYITEELHATSNRWRQLIGMRRPRGRDAA